MNMNRDFTKYIVKKWKGGINEEAFRITVGKYTYYIRLTKESNDIILDLGGRKRGCIKLRVPENNKALGNYSKFGAIKYVHYDPLCSANTDRDLVAGFGTKHMMKTALSIVKTICPNSNLKFFRFRDTSRKKCTDGSIVPLPYFMIALYGKTYYEQSFYAVIEDESLREQYNIAMQRRVNILPREYMSYQEFVVNMNIESDIATLLQPFYEKATSFEEFFTLIKEAYADRLCRILQDWIENFVFKCIFEGKDLTDVDWVIPMEKVQEIDIKDWTPMDMEKIDPYFVAQIQNQYSDGNQYLGLLVDFE